VYDGLAWWSEGSFRLVSLAALWSRLETGSLTAFQTTVERRVSVSLWSRILQPTLRVPAMPVFVGFGLVFLWIGRDRERRPDTGSIIGSRPPRRRRGRSGL
ncbi:MAG: hypothetical protein NTV97_30005, partial [Alphaproteobacteria bacterium]|nr:hypothetical protein [Alphaproteobacteria bacterium]